jgi:diguanylate cyclase (GGDEF)-like protein
VPQDRLERDRVLIARSVALLSADVPLNVLIDRICELLAEAFGGRATVALDETRDDACREPLRTPAEMSVPIVAGEDALGCIRVSREAGQAFTHDDQRVVEAVARYLGIAVRNQRSFRFSQFTARRPWLPIVLVCAIALAATAGLLVYSRGRIAETRTTAVSLQEGRLRQTALVLEDYVDDSVHLAGAVADVVGPMRENRQLAETLLVHFFQSIDDPAIFGLGIYYEPYRFDANSRLYDPYVDRKISRKTGGYDFYPTTPAYDYFNRGWYLLGRQSGGHIVFTHPYYEDALTYMSTLRPFYRGSEFAGVVSVDSLPKQVIALLRSRLKPGDVAWVTDGMTDPVLATGALPSNDPNRNELQTKVQRAPWTLHVSTDFTAVDETVRAIAVSATLVGAAIWLITLVVILTFVRSLSARLKSLDLQLKHVDLENEIAAHLDVEKRLRESAYRDSLTGLPNRPYFLEALAERLERLRSDPAIAFAVLFIDIDRFSVINDSLGHGAGDALLRLIAARIASALPSGTELARLGGDEFVALVSLEANDSEIAASRAHDVLARLREPFSMLDSELYSGASIGIVMSDPHYAQPEELLRDADIAMYQAKKTGRGRCVIFDAVMHDRARELLILESDLRRAVARGEVTAYYQPIVDTQTGRMVSMEALARWERPDGSVAGAAEFIEVAEQTGVLTAIDAIVLAKACRDAKELAREFGRPCEVSVNVSAAQLTRTDIVSDILTALGESDLPASSLKLEITETAIMENAEEALLVLNRLRALGLDIVVDDFGTGYSSLSYLRRLPISGLKIDRSFVIPMTTDAQAAAIVNAIVALAKTLSLKVTAEGVETVEQLDLLRSSGVDYAQGYYFSKAVPAGSVKNAVNPPSRW